ncbi:MAG: hypothetical protein J1F33_03095, partial [Clostridiales bacterium]|nr:hypothetical protein [Clostridiales bacterium]
CEHGGFVYKTARVPHCPPMVPKTNPFCRGTVLGFFFAHLYQDKHTPRLQIGYFLSYMSYSVPLALA